MSNNSRKALVVGIDHYLHYPLPSSVKSAKKMARLLSHHHDQSLNFSTVPLVSQGNRPILRRELLEELEELFAHEADVALFYFCGHGVETSRGGMLATQDEEELTEGVLVDEVLTLANRSRVGEIVILIDSCNSGNMGNLSMLHREHALLRKGVSILTSSTPAQNSEAGKAAGHFTQILLDALGGWSADLMGEVTVASIYEYANKLLGPWDPRPLLKVHASRMIALRRTEPRYSPETLLLMLQDFATPDELLQLGPEHEDTVEPRDTEKETQFKRLQEFVKGGLVMPVGAPHMYFAAIHHKHCALTPFGKLYWKIMNNRRQLPQNLD